MCIVARLPIPIHEPAGAGNPTAMAERTVKPLSSFIARVLDDGAARKMRDTENLCRRWATLAPRDLAAHTRPVRYDHGQLILETDSPGWAARLRYQHGTWLAQLRQTSEFSELRQIQFRVHPRGD